ncbi:MAG: RNA recognition motif domain-containing protein [Flavisolibacter sp.]
MNLYISNIGNHVTDESLRAIFATHGLVHDIRVTAHTDTARVAWIHMPEDDAKEALEHLNGRIINGCSISVERFNDPASGPSFI